MSSAIVIQSRPLPYAKLLARRRLEEIRWAVIHCTELPDLAMAREYGEQIHYRATGTGNCGHYYIDRDGAISQFVPLDRVAHHVAGHNQQSLGIELVNTGRFPHWHHSQHQQMTEAYSREQIDALLRLLRQLDSQLPELRWIAGHEQLDRRQVPATDNPALRVPRKLDPGPLFPWPTVLAATALKLLPDDAADCPDGD